MLADQLFDARPPSSCTACQPDVCAEARMLVLSSAPPWGMTCVVLVQRRVLLYNRAEYTHTYMYTRMYAVRVRIHTHAYLCICMYTHVYN